MMLDYTHFLLLAFSRIHRRENAGPEGTCILHFNGHCQITLRRSCTNFLFYQQPFNFRNEESEAQRLNIMKI